MSHYQVCSAPLRAAPQLRGATAPRAPRRVSAWLRAGNPPPVPQSGAGGTRHGCWRRRLNRRQQTRYAATMPAPPGGRRGEGAPTGWALRSAPRRAAPRFAVARFVPRSMAPAYRRGVAARALGSRPRPPRLGRRRLIRRPAAAARCSAALLLALPVVALAPLRAAPCAAPWLLRALSPPTGGVPSLPPAGGAQGGASAAF